MTGDIECGTNAHNLSMVALTSRMQHEANYDDAKLAKIGLRRLDIDPNNVQIKWAIDFCAQAMRNIIIGRGGKMDGVEMESGAQISVSSEVMAILAVSKDLADLRHRMSKIVVAYDKQGNPVTTRDLEVDGAMTAWMVDALNPNLVQTIEGQPILVHAGPFANIAIGQSSIIADLVATRLCEYVVTESGFAADIGFEKFWNLNVGCLDSTARGGIGLHGTGIEDARRRPAVKPGPAAPEYKQENSPCWKKAARTSFSYRDRSQVRIRPVVCINKFYTDTEAELKLVRTIAERAGAEAAVSDHWLRGGEGPSNWPRRSRRLPRKNTSLSTCTR